MIQRKYRLVAIFVLLALSLVPLSQVFAQASPTAVVNTGALNIRSGPGVGYSVITSVYRGTGLTLLARNADASWVKIMLGTGTQGWVSSPYIATAYPLASLPLDTGVPGGATATVTSYGLNVRTGPGNTYAKITAIGRGTGVMLLARNTDASWAKVALFDGRQGWVNTGYITTAYSLWNLPVEGVTPPAPPPTQYRTHVVQPGENLFRIALNYGANMYQIAELNGIYNLRLIYAGQVLLIP